MKDFGLTGLWRKPEDYGLPLILGGAEASLWDLCGAYAGLARRALGKEDAFFPPHAWGAPPRHDSAGGPGLSAGAAFLTLDAMKEVIRPEDQAGWRSFVGARRVAWKTGTSSSYKDAWAIGVTTDYVVGVWVGNADGVGRPDLLGFKAAAPILFEVYNRLPDTTWFPTPWSDLKSVEVCKASGYAQGSHCPESTAVWVPRSSPATETCPYHVELLLDAKERWQVDSRIIDVSKIVHKTWFVLPPSVVPFFSSSHVGYRPPPPLDPRIAAWSNDAISIAVPSYQTKLIVPVELDGTPGQFLAVAYHSDPHSVLFWSLDGQYLASTEGNHTLALRPRAGQHLLTLVDGQGRTATRTFEVLAESISERFRKNPGSP